MKFLNPIKLRRLIVGIKQQELADEVGISESTLSKIETGRRRPTDEEAKKIAKKLGCKVDRLFDMEDVRLPEALPSAGKKR